MKLKKLDTKDSILNFWLYSFHTYHKNEKADRESTKSTAWKIKIHSSSENVSEVSLIYPNTLHQNYSLLLTLTLLWNGILKA